MKLKFTNRSLILCLALLFLPLGWAFAQQVQTPGYESGSAGTDLAATPIPLTPIPLTRLRDSAGQTANTAVKPLKESSLGRFVTIGFGALPFLFFYTNLAFDDIVMFEAANDNAILLAAYGYHPSSVEIRG